MVERFELTIDGQRDYCDAASAGADSGDAAALRWRRPMRPADGAAVDAPDAARDGAAVAAADAAR